MKKNKKKKKKNKKKKTKKKKKKMNKKKNIMMIMRSHPSSTRGAWLLGTPLVLGKHPCHPHGEYYPQSLVSDSNL